MSGPLTTKIIQQDTGKDADAVIRAKLEEYPYLLEEHMEEKRAQLKLLVCQGASDAFIQTLFGNPDEMDAQQIDIIRSIVRMTDERFFYDHLYQKQIQMQEALELVRFNLFAAGTQQGSDTEVSDDRGYPDAVVFSSATVCTQVHVEMDRIKKEIIDTLTDCIREIAESAGFGAEYAKHAALFLAAMENVAEKQKRSCQDGNHAYESTPEHDEEEAAIYSVSAEIPQKGIFGSGVGNARAPNFLRRLIHRLMARCTGLSDEALLAKDEYRKARRTP